MKFDDVPESLLEAIHLHTTGDESWPEPQPIKCEQMPVRRFHKNLLPKSLRKRVYDVAHRMQCPPEFVAVPLLVMLGSVISTGCGIRPKQRDEWLEYPNLWGGIVAPPGALKSPAISQGLSAFGVLERRAHAEHEQAQVRHISDGFMREHQLGLLKAKMKPKGNQATSLTQADYDQMAELSKEVQAPTPRRFRAQDTTVEKLGEILAGNPRGLLVHRDELVGFLAALERPGQEGARAFYLEAWNGKESFSIDRIGRGSIRIPQLSVSVLGGIQPGRLRDYLYDSQSNYNDGLIQRFQLLVCPDRFTSNRTIDQVEDRAAREAIDKIVEQLAYGDFSVIGADREERGEVVRFSYRYHLLAQAIFNEWLRELDQRIAAEETPIMAEHMSKFRKLVPALSLIFHLVDRSVAGDSVARIAPATLRRAIRWSEFLESHARRIYDLGRDGRHLPAERLGEKLKCGELADGFSERDVYRKNWATLDDPDVVRAACRELEEAGWIRRLPSEHGLGRPTSPSYRINPMLGIREVK